MQPAAGFTSDVRAYDGIMYWGFDEGLVSAKFAEESA